MIGILYLVSLVGAAILLLWLLDRYRDRRDRDRRSPGQIAEAEAYFRTRLMSPNWEAVLAKTNGHPSPSLQALYRDTGTVTRRDFSVHPLDPEPEQPVEIFLAHFQPADAQAFDDPWREFMPGAAFTFAVDYLGDPLYVELTPDRAESAVWRWHHDGGDKVLIAASLGEFLSWPRKDVPFASRT